MGLEPDAITPSGHIYLECVMSNFSGDLVNSLFIMEQIDFILDTLCGEHMTLFFMHA
jgi:hypothetical protein